MSVSLLTISIRYEHDVVLSRQRARQLAGLLGFDRQDQVRIATAVSELARNAFQYADKGKVEFLAELTSPLVFRIRISDQGKGIPHLQRILDGQYCSPTGMGLGILGAHRLMDRCQITSNPGEGTIILLEKIAQPAMPSLTSKDVASLMENLAKQPPLDPVD